VACICPRCSAICWARRYAIGQLGLYRFVWHPPLFNAALYVILLSAFVTATL
jgi:protein AaeX